MAGLTTHYSLYDKLSADGGGCGGKTATADTQMSMRKSSSHKTVWGRLVHVEDPKIAKIAFLKYHGGKLRLRAN